MSHAGLLGVLWDDEFDLLLDFLSILGNLGIVDNGVKNILIGVIIERHTNKQGEL